MSHTGIVIYSDDLYVYTIEGNTSDQVAIKRWSLNDARILAMLIQNTTIFF